MKCVVVVVCLLIGSSAFASDAIEAVVVRGNHRIETETIRLAISSRAGRTLEPATLRDDVRAIWKLGVFSDVQVGTEPGASGPIVVFDVVERPQIRKIVVAGNQELSLDKINDVLDLRRDAVADFVAMRKNRDKIAELYTSQGFLYANVDVELVPVSEREADVRFTIDEHAKVVVGDITFIGNHAISTADLRAAMATRPPGALSFLNGSGVFRRDMLEQDLSILTAYYLDRGFAAVKIGAPDLRISRDRKRMTVAIAIDEGPRFTYAAIDIKGDLIGTPAQQLALIRSRVGQTFSRATLAHDREALERHYQDLGFAHANVAIRPKLDHAHRLVTLGFEIVRGKRVFVEQIHIRGNSKTRDKVIRREMRIAEGELFSASRLEESRRQIIALGYFENVTVSTQRGSSDDYLDINVEVLERRTGTVQLGAGIASRDGLIAQGQVAQENFLGRGWSLQAQVMLSSVRRLFLLRFVEPYMLDTKWTFAGELYNQSTGLGAYSRTATGGALTWGHPLSDHVRASVTYRLEDIGITSNVPLTLDTANLFRGGWTSSIRGGLTWDTRDNRLFPTDGVYATAFAEYAGKLTGSQNQFVRWGGFARRYQRIGPFVLRLNGEVGVTTSLDGRGVPLTERYLLGGISDIRGYAPRSLGPHLWSQHPGDVGQPLDPLAIGGNLQVIGNAELEFPLVKRLGISGVAFFDIGNAYNLESRFCGRPGSDACVGTTGMIGGLRKSVGVGVRWMSPLGPLRFEWGLPLDLKPGEKPAGLEFMMGGSF